MWYVIDRMNVDILVCSYNADLFADNADLHIINTRLLGKVTNTQVRINNRDENIG